MNMSRPSEELSYRQVLFCIDLENARDFYAKIPEAKIRDEEESIVVKIGAHELVIFVSQDRGLVLDNGAIFHLKDIEDFYQELSAYKTIEMGELQTNCLDHLQFEAKDQDGNSLFFIENSDHKPRSRYMLN